jgi:hypothetical protein
MLLYRGLSVGIRWICESTSTDSSAARSLLNVPSRCRGCQLIKDDSTLMPASPLTVSLTIAGRVCVRLKLVESREMQAMR